MKTKREQGSSDPLIQETVERLRRRVAWQVHAAYGVPLPPEAEPEPEVEAEPALLDDQPSAKAPPTPPPRLHRLPTIDELERLVAAAEARGREGAQQWRWTVYYLRGFSDGDGRLPQMFEPLIAPLYSDAT
jgi:hypothetical protein